METLSPCHNASIGKLYKGKCDVCAKPVDVSSEAKHEPMAENEEVKAPEATPEATPESAPAEATPEAPAAEASAEAPAEAAPEATPEA